MAGDVSCQPFSFDGDGDVLPPPTRGSMRSERSQATTARSHMLSRSGSMPSQLRASTGMASLGRRSTGRPPEILKLDEGGGCSACSCGNIYLSDERFCRRCGARRFDVSALGSSARSGATLQLHNGSASFAAMTPGAAGGGSLCSLAGAPLKTHKQVYDDLRNSYWKRAYGSRKNNNMQTMNEEHHADFSHCKEALKVPSTFYDGVRRKDKEYAATVGKVPGEFEASTHGQHYKNFTPSEKGRSVNLPCFTGWHTHVLSDGQV